MKRALFTLLLALVPCACIDNGGGAGVQSYGPVYCGQFTSCNTCTPVLGCGWCSMGDKGACVDQPNACAGAASFYWTWELSGCAGAADAGIRGDGNASAPD